MKLIQIKDTFIAAEYIAVIGKDTEGRHDGLRYQIYIRLMSQEDEEAYESGFSTEELRDGVFCELLDFLMCDDRKIFNLI